MGSSKSGPATCLPTLKWHDNTPPARRAEGWKWDYSPGTLRDLIEWENKGQDTFTIWKIFMKFIQWTVTPFFSWWLGIKEVTKFTYCQMTSNNMKTWKLNQTQTFASRKCQPFCSGSIFSLNPLHAKFFRGNINMYLHFMSFFFIDMTQVVEILPQIRPGPTHSQYHGCCCAGDARSQGISSYDIDLVKPR